MPFKKNVSGNPKGKPRGTKSRKTKQWEIFSEYIISGGLTKFQKELNKLKGKEYVITFTSLLEFFKPKLGRIDYDAEIVRAGKIIKLLLKDNECTERTNYMTLISEADTDEKTIIIANDYYVKFGNNREL